MMRDDFASDQNRLRMSLVQGLAIYQQSEDWDGRTAMEVFHRWAKRFDAKFKLGIPELVIRIDTLPLSQLGGFHGEHIEPLNGLGRQKGASKLRKYSCGCTNIRVAKKEFRAVCLLCGNEFFSEDGEAPGSYDDCANGE